MVDERDANRLWQKIFRCKSISSQTLSEADRLLNGMSPESPLRLRFIAELDEICALQLETPRKK